MAMKWDGGGGSFYIRDLSYEQVEFDIATATIISIHLRGTSIL